MLNVGVALIDDKIRENSLRWVGHLCRRWYEIVRSSDMVSTRGGVDQN